MPLLVDVLWGIDALAPTARQGSLLLLLKKKKTTNPRALFLARLFVAEVLGDESRLGCIVCHSSGAAAAIELQAQCCGNSSSRAEQEVVASRTCGRFGGEHSLSHLMLAVVVLVSVDAAFGVADDAGDRGLGSNERRG